mmetsp:Transcript_24139/g.50968  ORF Transcript_24139/g.50968 Transcript_24139/m.50968 type:complete len:309 (+) Transcript_24139:37-963(+)
MKRSDSDGSHLALNEADPSTLSRALSEAIHVAGNESFDPCNGCEHRPGGADLRDRLEERWNELILSTSGGTGKSKTEATDAWFQKIYEKHTEPGRHYHTSVHLWEMFELLDVVIACNGNGNRKCRSSFSASKWRVPMAWSVLFHDSIYDSKSSRNEKDSAELFREFVLVDKAIAMDGAMFDAVLAIILATEKHEVIAKRGVDVETDAEFIVVQKHFLDIDMAVLGKHKKAYLKYAALIRKEYEFVPHDVYCSKRAEILETFLGSGSTNASMETKHIYLTDAFREAFENRARVNLREEIDLLRKNTIPG